MELYCATINECRLKQLLESYQQWELLAHQKKESERHSVFVSLQSEILSSFSVLDEHQQMGSLVMKVLNFVTAQGGA